MGRPAAPFWLTLALLVGTVALTRLLPYGREGVLPVPLQAFPVALGEWSERSGPAWRAPAAPATASTTLFRVYGNGKGQAVSLYIVHWKRQGPGELAFGAHHAAPGQAWAFVREDLVRIASPSRWGSQFSVTRTIYERSGERQLVTYWFVQPQRRVVGSRYWGGVYMLWDYVSRQRSDVVLVRIATPANGSGPWPGFDLHERFIRAALPTFERFFGA